MSFTVVALLMSAWGMGLGFLMYRYASSLVRRLQATGMAEAERRGWGEFAGTSPGGRYSF